MRVLQLDLLYQTILSVFVALYLLAQVHDDLLLSFDSLLLAGVLFFEAVDLLVEFVHLLAHLRYDLDLLLYYLLILLLLLLMQVLRRLYVLLHTIDQFLLIPDRDVLLTQYY